MGRKTRGTANLDQGSWNAGDNRFMTPTNMRTGIPKVTPSADSYFGGGGGGESPGVANTRARTFPSGFGSNVGGSTRRARVPPSNRLGRAARTSGASKTPPGKGVQ